MDAGRATLTSPGLSRYRKTGRLGTNYQGKLVMTKTLPALSIDLSRKGGLDRLAIALALFKDYISIQKGAAHLDSSKLAEGLVKDLLNLLGPWGAFKTLDHEYTNHPAIDLLSLDGDVGVQVTSSSSLTKVTETIEKFHRLNVPPKQLYILMICGRAKSYGNRLIGNGLQKWLE